MKTITDTPEDPAAAPMDDDALFPDEVGAVDDEGERPDERRDGQPDGQADGQADGQPDGQPDGLADAARLARAATGVPDEQLAAWIDAIVGRDERALAALYDATFASVFGLVRRIVRDRATAEEVVEDSYFQVWRQAPRFDPARGHALGWLLAIARSRAIDALRRGARFQHEVLDEDKACELASDAAAADELLQLARQRSDLQQALMLLGAQPRQLVSLAFFCGLSHEEIAQQTQIPLGTVKSQIRRALLSLRRSLGDHGGLVAAA
jgi:RNA polymerase sigma-70 factor (ECF subfamily)